MTNRNSTQASRSTATDQAAIFVDYDNLHDVLSDQSDGDRPPVEYVTEILGEVRRYLEEGDDTPTILTRAYGDFGALSDVQDVAAQLDDEGVDPRFAPTDGQPNASELRLTIELTSMLHQRPDVHTFVIVTGSRLYLPLVRAVREQGARPLVVAVNPPLADEPISRAEEDLYLDARNLLSRNYREDLQDGESSSRSSSTREPSTGQSAPNRRYGSLDDDIVRRTVAITEEHFGQYDEVYLTPLLRKLSDVLGERHDPKSLVSELEAAGAVHLEKRDGYPYDYTVLIVNDDHPDVREIQDEHYENRSRYGGNGQSDDYENYDPGQHDEDAYDYGDYQETDYETYDDEYDDEYDADEYEEDPYGDEEDSDEASHDEESYDDEAYDEEEDYGDIPSPTDPSDRMRGSDEEDEVADAEDLT